MLKSIQTYYSVEVKRFGAKKTASSSLKVTQKKQALGGKSG